MKTRCYPLDKVAAYAFVLAAFALIQPQAIAQTRTWTGGGGNANSSNASNWQEGAPAVSTSYDVVYDPANLVSTFRTTATYNTTGFGFTSISLAGNETYPGFTLMGSTATTLNGPITVHSGIHNFNVTTTVTTDSTWDVASGAQLKLGSSSPSVTLALDKKITKTGLGNLYMEGSQTGIAGTIQLNAGTITAQNAAAMGTASLILNSGTLALVRNNNTTYGNNVTVGGDVSVMSGRTGGEGAGINMTLGTLAIGNQTLTVGAGDQVTSGTARSTFGATTLSGAAVFNVTNNVANVASRLVLGAVGGAGQSLTKTGDGELLLSGANTYTGTTTVDSGLLLITGDSSAATGALTVNAGAILGGSGRVGGDISFANGAKFLFDAATTLTADGTVSFDSFSISDLIGLDGTVAEETFTLIAGNVNFANVSNVGLANAVAIGGGKSAYFQEGSLQLVVIPEPATIGMLGLGALIAAFIRRKLIR
jgi:fibronectin-binding autotransporter adhesin